MSVLASDITIKMSYSNRDAQKSQRQFPKHDTRREVPRQYNKDRELPKNYGTSGQRSNRSHSRSNSRGRSRSKSRDRYDDRNRDRDRQDFDRNRFDRIKNCRSDSKGGLGPNDRYRDSPNNFQPKNNNYNRNRKDSPNYRNGKMPELQDLPGFVPGLFSGIDFSALKLQENKERKEKIKLLKKSVRRTDNGCSDTFVKREKSDSKSSRLLQSTVHKKQGAESPIPDLNDDSENEPAGSTSRIKRYRSKSPSKSKRHADYDRGRKRSQNESPPRDKRYHQSPKQSSNLNGSDIDIDSYDGYYPRSPVPVQNLYPDDEVECKRRKFSETAALPIQEITNVDVSMYGPALPPPVDIPKTGIKGSSVQNQELKCDAGLEDGELSSGSEDNSDDE